MPYTFSKTQLLLSRLIEILVYVLFKPFTKKWDNVSIKRILIVEPYLMGDVISVSVMLDPLKARYPEAGIYLLLKDNMGELFQHDSRISKVLLADFPWSDYGRIKGSPSRWVKLFKTIMKLRSYSFDLGIDPRGDIRSQVVLSLTSCKYRLSYLNYVQSTITVRGLLLTHKLERSRYQHRHYWNLELLTLIGIKVPQQIEFPTYHPTLTLNTPESQKPGRKRITIHIGGGGRYKKWNIPNWIDLIRRIDKLWEIDMNVIGGKKEVEILAQIENRVSNNTITFKVTDYSELCYYLAIADVIICLDSGPMNVAVCMNKKVIALFGPGDSEAWAPINPGSTFIHYKDDFPCNPCDQRKCYFLGNNCMDRITVDNVVQKVAQLL